MTIPIPWLERVPTYNRSSSCRKRTCRRSASSAIRCSRPPTSSSTTRMVPVGEPGPHLELSREIVRRSTISTGAVRRTAAAADDVSAPAGLDNRKMSKSYGNTINLSDDAKTVEQKVRQMYGSQADRADIPGRSKATRCSRIRRVQSRQAEVEDLKARYRAGKVGDVEVKMKLARALNAHLEPMRARRADLAARPERLREILHEGSKKARGIAMETMERVRAAVKLKCHCHCQDCQNCQQLKDLVRDVGRPANVATYF